MSLYQLCQYYGLNAKIWLRKFAGLLPEVYKRDLHRQHGCASIHEFAKKLAGMHERTVDKILNLHKRLQSTPHLLKIFESGKQGWSKLEKIIFIATPETDLQLSEMVKNLPTASLEEYVKSQRGKLTHMSQVQNNFGILQAGDLQAWPQVLSNCSPNQSSILATSHNATSNPSTDQKFNQVDPSSPVLGQLPHIPSGPSAENHPPDQLRPISHIFRETFSTISFPISTQSRSKLQLIKHQLEKKHRRTLAYDEIIKLMPMQATVIIKKVCPKCAMKAVQISSAQATTPAPTPSAPQRVPNKLSRPIPKSIQKLILSQHGQFCVFPNCHRPYREFHHTKRFASLKNHDPANIYPLCKTHHTLAHAGLIANENLAPKSWYIKKKPEQSSVDKKAMKFKNPT